MLRGNAGRSIFLDDASRISSPEGKTLKSYTVMQNRPREQRIDDLREKSV